MYQPKTVRNYVFKVEIFVTTSEGIGYITDLIIQADILSCRQGNSSVICVRSMEFRMSQKISQIESRI